MSIPSDLCDKFYKSVAEYFSSKGWKYLKSTHILKQRVGDIVFQIYMGTSWSNSADFVRVRSGLISHYKKISDVDNQDSMAIAFQFRPQTTHNGEWWEITTPEQFHAAVKDVCYQIDTAVTPILDAIKSDLQTAVREYAINGIEHSFLTPTKEYPRIEFVGVVLGKDRARKSFMKIYSEMSEQGKKRIINGVNLYLSNIERARNLRLNNAYLCDSDIMYMVDNEIITVNKKNELVFLS